MSFTAKDVSKLREMTGAGMMNCKKALEEAAGNMEEAINYLRQKGIASAAKKAGNIAAEGLITTKVAEDKKSAVIVEVNSQTDFVAKNEDFKKFVADVAQVALEQKISDINKLLQTSLNGKNIKDVATELTAKIGEKVDVRRVALINSSALVASYVHPVGSKIGVLVSLSQNDATKANDLAMHIAAASPTPEYIDKSAIAPETIAKEKEIESKKDDLQGKPAEMIEKIVAGRVDKLLASKVLLEQAFVKDPNQKISQYLGNIKVENFVRFNLGEGIEKKESNFADEVAAAMSA